MTRPKILVTPPFTRALNRLYKRFGSVKSQIRQLLTQLESGETPGDHMTQTGYTVYKVRLANPDAQRGKSGGFRVIYYVQKADMIWLMDIYSKTDQTDIPTTRIIDLIRDMESGNS